MIKTIIIGKRSVLTNSLAKHLNNFEIISQNDKDLERLQKFRSEKINIIFNNFFPSSKLNNLNSNDFDKFSKYSIFNLSKILSGLNKKKICKIIYTSSSSVYNISQNISSTKPDKVNRALYSSFKLSAEKLIKNFSIKNNIDYYIMRIFNLYGDPNDNFSFIENIIKKKIKGEKIKVINNGASIRDFIHVDDVSKIYFKVLNKKFETGYYDIGTGKGYSIKSIVDLLNFKQENIVAVNKVEELTTSIADNKKIKKQVSDLRFKDLDLYLSKKVRIKKFKKINPIFKFQKNKNIQSGSVIYGAGFAGKVIFNELLKINEDVIFFIDDDISKQNTFLNGIPIISYENLLDLKNTYNFKKIYLTIPSLNKKMQNFLIRKIKKNFFDVRFLPEKKFLISDKIDVNDLNIDEINDILKRKQFYLKKIKKLQKQNILVTGAAGTIGSEICRQLISQNTKKVVGIDKSEIGIYNLNKKLDNKIIYCLGDVNDHLLVDQIVKKNKIDLIIHTAAYKHVNIIEKNIFSAVKNNIFATKNLCEVSIKNSCNFLFISTDKAANPKSILGITKRIAEQICLEYASLRNDKKFVNIVRFGNVFGSSGSAITNFLDQINNEKPVTITNKNATRFFMTIQEACHLVLQITNIKKKGEIFILNMGKPINIFQLAKDLAKIKNKINPFYVFDYKEIGLQPGEKLHETLVDDKEIKLKLSDEIFLVKSKNKPKRDLTILINSLYENYYKLQSKKLTSTLKKIIS